MKISNVFVTVGSTKFDKLINTIVTDDVLKALKAKGCHSITIQKGLSECNIKTNDYGIDMNVYQYKNSITDDILNAHFIIGHAGSGTVMEVLRHHKPLLVVSNDDLMDNHQIELSQQLSSDGYLFSCTPLTLAETISSINLSELNTFPDADSTRFSKFLDEKLGFC